MNKATKWVDLTAQQVKLLMKPGLWEVYVATVNQGLPNKLLGAGRGAGQARGRAAQGEVGRSAAPRPAEARPSRRDRRDAEPRQTFPRVAARAAARRAARRPWGAIALFLGPTLLLYFAFTIYPVLVTFYNSVHSLRMDLGMQYEFVGLEHFREILTSDDVFWKAARNSLTCGPWWRRSIDIPLALGLALVLHARVPFARFFRTVWFTPVLMSYPVVGVIWLWVYNYDWGMANLVLRAVGLGDYAQAWLASPATALPALILVTTWMFAGFNMVVLLAAIHAIPADYLDAARVDGAGAWQPDASHHRPAAAARPWSTSPSSTSSAR